MVRCLRRLTMTPPALLRRWAAAFCIYVEELEWWQYYPGHVVGKGRGGLFVFSEATHAVRYFKGAEGGAAQRCHARTAPGGRYLPRKTPADGWNEAWMPLIRERCRQFEKDSGGTSHTSEEVKAAMRRYCDRYPRVERSNPPMQRICGVAGLTNHRAVCECGFRLRSARLAPAGR